jgi:hypothetical protein
MFIPLFEKLPNAITLLLILLLSCPLVISLLRLMSIPLFETCLMPSPYTFFRFPWSAVKYCDVQGSTCKLNSGRNGSPEFWFHDFDFWLQTNLLVAVFQGGMEISSSINTRNWMENLLDLDKVKVWHCPRQDSQLLKSFNCPVTVNVLSREFGISICFPGRLGIAREYWGTWLPSPC